MVIENTHKSPFKFLDPYGVDDFKVFFGRDKEVRELYEHVNKNRIVLVYGQSGTGKTSIIKCGLANTFEPSDWLPFFVRRNGNINESLQEMVGNKWQPSPEELAAVKAELFSTEGQRQIGLINTPERFRTDYQDYVCSLLFNIRKHCQHSLRPVYIIFDQFEELLILGTHEERELFIFILKFLARPNAVTSCHVIIVMREEYFGWLDFVEKEIPEVADRRLRVETMRVNELREVIEKSCKRFNIEFENPHENISQIVKALSKRGEISLPYLQVYLDQLWREDYTRTYNGKEPPEGKYAPLTFTTDEIKKFGEIKDVLQRFLIERKDIIQKEVKKTFPHVDDDFVSSVLDCFVNDQGTKRPFQYEVVNGLYCIKDGDNRIFKSFDQKALSFTLKELEENQILRNNANYFELAHDILAKLIDGQRDSRQKRLNGIRIMISLYKKQNEIIPYNLIKSWEKDIDKLMLKPDEQNFYQQSKQDGYRKETKEYVNKAIKREMERRKYRRIILLLVLAISILVLLGYFFWNNLKRENAYYAIDSISNMDTVKNTQEAMLMSRYFYEYRFKELDARKTNTIQTKFLELARSESLTKSFAFSKLTLQSSTGLVAGFDVDLSYSGRYVSVRNDAHAQVNEPANFALLNTSTNQVDYSFQNVLYAYFLEATDTLIVALLDIDRRNEEDNPNGFILFDCKGKKIISTIWMNSAPADRNYLYDKNYLASNVFSYWDNFKIRMDKSGKLIIPYFTYKDHRGGYGKSKVTKLDIRSIDGQVLYNTPSEFSISISKKGDKAIYAFPDKTGTSVFYQYSAAGSFDQALFSGATFADFTENDHILFNDRNFLKVVDNNGIEVRKARVNEWFRYAYAGSSNNYAVLALEDSVGVLNFNKESIKTFEGKLVGFNFNARRIITHISTIDENDKKINQLMLWDFKGDSLKSFRSETTIDSVSFNSMSNSILIKCAKGEKIKNPILYLLDGNLDVMATLTLTPNDTYGFSGNGQNYYYVRDNSLCVFRNEPSINATDINTMYQWLDIQREKLGSKYKDSIGTLLKKHHLARFRTDRLSF